MSDVSRILIVEDDRLIAAMLHDSLNESGMIAEIAQDGVEMDVRMRASNFDLVILDVMLPGESGLQLARRWRADARTRQVPIILLTARGDENDRVAGLDVGADDYITKPFSTKELLARIRAVLRRRAPEPETTLLELGRLTLDTGTYRVHFGDQPIKLGPTEFKLLHYLMRNAERVHTRAQLLDRVWGDHVFIEERTVDVHVKRLRESMGPAAPMIETVRGAGYRITAHAPVATAR